MASIDVPEQDISFKEWRKAAESKTVLCRSKIVGPTIHFEWIRFEELKK